MEQSPSRERLTTDDPIRKALMEGSPYPMLTVTDAKEADAIVSTLRDAAARNRWLLSLVAADPKRVLRAAGITFEGVGKQRFEQRRQELGWVDRPAEFDRIVTTPSRATGQGATRPVVLYDGTKDIPQQSGDTSERWTLSTAIGRVQALAQTSYTPISLPTTGDSQSAVPSAEEGYSHAAPINYTGITLPWDTVIQLHESCLKRQYEVLFAAQRLLAAIEPGSPDVIDYRFDFESWLLVFVRVHLEIDFVGSDRAIVTMDGADLDEVGVRLPFTATTYTRWTPSDEWGEWETFTGTFTRYGEVVKRWPIELAGETFRRTWAADLANGRNVIDLGGAADDTREMLIEAAANAYIAAELPLLPVTPTVVVHKPLMTYPNSAAFTTSLEPDRRAVSLCFSEEAEALKDTAPFRSYILDHGRNVAVGISIAAVERELLGSLELPVSDGGVTVETVNLTGGAGRLHLRSEGKALLGINFSHTVDVLLYLEDGELTAELDDSTLNLPWWLWALNTLLFVPFFGVYGLLPMAIANIVGSKIVGGKMEDLIDLSSLVDSVNGGIGTNSVATTTIQRVEVNPFGVFLKGDVEITIT